MKCSLIAKKINCEAHLCSIDPWKTGFKNLVLLHHLWPNVCETRMTYTDENAAVLLQFVSPRTAEDFLEDIYNLVPISFRFSSVSRCLPRDLLLLFQIFRVYVICSSVELVFHKTFIRICDGSRVKYVSDRNTPRINIIRITTLTILHAYRKLCEQQCR